MPPAKLLLLLIVCCGGLTYTVLAIRPMRMVTKKVAIRPTANVSVDGDFAVRFFYQQLTSRDYAPGSNILFSPISIVTTLAALAEGANGSTATELYRLLNADNGASLRQKMVRTLSLLKSSQYFTLLTVNRIFVQDGYPLLVDFEDTLRNHYRMTVERTDFRKPEEAERRINEWVSEVTRNHITSLIPPNTLDALSRMVLTNAVFFKGDWQTTFDAAATELRPFYLDGKREIQVPMMLVEAPFPYHNFERLGFEMVELPYAGGGQVSMFVVLPYETQSLLSVARRLKSRPFLLCHRLKRLNTKQEVTVLLPKFELQESIDVKTLLQSMGVSKVFDPDEADLSKVAGNREIHVSDAFHRAGVEVTERGTKAAAATAVVVKGRSMSLDPVFRADRPFVFFLRHNPSSSILFMGAVTSLPDSKPSQNDETTV